MVLSLDFGLVKADKHHLKKVGSYVLMGLSSAINGSIDIGYYQEHYY